MAYISVAEAAERWQLSERRVQKFARDGRIPGAKKFSGSWAIPEDAARHRPRRACLFQRPGRDRRSDRRALP